MNSEMQKRALAARDAHLALLDLKKVVDEVTQTTHAAEMEAVHLAITSRPTGDIFTNDASCSGAAGIKAVRGSLEQSAPKLADSDVLAEHRETIPAEFDGELRSICFSHGRPSGAASRWLAWLETEVSACISNLHSHPFPEAILIAVHQSVLRS